MHFMNIEWYYIMLRNTCVFEEWATKVLGAFKVSPYLSNNCLWHWDNISGLGFWFKSIYLRIGGVSNNFILLQP